jgi:hypothetical protein
MTDGLRPEEQALRRAAGEVLHYIVDPIGVAGSVQARGEYDGYIDQVYGLLWQGAGAHQISGYLVKLADQNMDMPDTQARADLAVGRLVAGCSRTLARLAVHSS